MKISTDSLLEELRKLTQHNLIEAQNFLRLEDELLLKRPSEKAWNVLECITHLNFYGEFYIPEIQKQMSKSNTTASPTFSSGWLGNYFASIMYPSEKSKSMNTLKRTNPLKMELNRECLHDFIVQQQQILELLDEATKHNLNKVKTGISLTKLIRLKLGDTLRVLIYHNFRHIKQANRTLENNNY